MSNASDESAPGRRVCWPIAFSALDAYGAPSLMAVLRLSEFERLLSVRYARTLPDADAGDDDLFIAVQFNCRESHARSLQIRRRRARREGRIDLCRKTRV